MAATRVTARPLTADDCARVLAQDEALYPPPPTTDGAPGAVAVPAQWVWDAATRTVRPREPTPARPPPPPLRPEHVAAWLQRTPQFSAVFEATPSGEAAGVLVTVALNERGWAELASGRLDEADLVPRAEFDAAPNDDACYRYVYDPARGDAALALHVYHVERTAAWAAAGAAGGAPFSQRCFQHLGAAWRQLRDAQRRAGRPVPTLLGFSALTVTAAGERLFRDRLGFAESAFCSPLYVVERATARATVSVAGAAAVADRPAVAAALAAAVPGAAAVQPVRFLRLDARSTVPSPVWQAGWFGAPAPP